MMEGNRKLSIGSAKHLRQVLHHGRHRVSKATESLQAGQPLQAVSASNAFAGSTYLAQRYLPLDHVVRANGSPPASSIALYPLAMTYEGSQGADPLHMFDYYPMPRSQSS
jgi:hypothetical protein